MNNKAKRLAKLERRRKLAESSKTPKAISQKKTSPTPKMPRREACGCERRWNTKEKKWEGYAMCLNHKAEFAKALREATAKEVAK